MRVLFDQPEPHEALGAFLARSAHAYTRADLMRWFTRRHLERALSADAVTALGYGLFVGQAHAESPVVRGEVINCRWPTSWVSGELALHLYAPQLPIPAHSDVIMPRGSHPTSMAGVRVRQIGPLSAYGYGSGVRCAPPATALLDAWHRARPDRREDVLYRALWAKVCSWKQLRAELAKTSRVAGRRQLLDLLGWFESGAHSPLEVRALRDVFVGPDFTDFERQVTIEVGGRTLRADMVHRTARLIVELDGAGTHGGYAATTADHQRDADLAAAGYLTLRFGWSDIVQRPEWCRDRVRKTLASRRLRP